MRAINAGRRRIGRSLTLVALCLAFYAAPVSAQQFGIWGPRA